MAVEATTVTIYAGDTVLVADAPAWLQRLEPRSALALPAWRGAVLLSPGVRLPESPCVLCTTDGRTGVITFAGPPQGLRALMATPLVAFTGTGALTLSRGAASWTHFLF
jgi:hypothetical protein